MNIQKYLPEHHLIVREGLIVVGGVLLAAFFLSRFPKLKAFVSQASITVDDKQGNNLF